MYGARVVCVGSARPHGSQRAPLSQAGRHVLTKSRCRIVRCKTRLAHPYSAIPPWPRRCKHERTHRCRAVWYRVVLPGTVEYWLVLWLSQERIHGIKGWNLVERRRRFVCEARMCTVSATKTLKTVQHRCACCMLHGCIRRAVAPSCCLLTAMVGLRRGACRYGFLFSDILLLARLPKGTQEVATPFHAMPSHAMLVSSPDRPT